MLRKVIWEDGDAAPGFYPKLKQTFKSHRGLEKTNKADERVTAVQRWMGPESKAVLFSPQENTDFNSVRHFNCIH